jgi:hypothetical protein
MDKSSVSRETYQRDDEKKRILFDFVQNYEPSISLSPSGYIKFYAFGVIVEIDLCKCIVLSSSNVLYIRWLQGKNYIVVNIEA